MLPENLAKIKQNIEGAAKKANRPPNSIKIIAITKNQPIPGIREARKLGIGDFGENRVQEAIPKISAIPATWHFVGRLQSNKVRKAVQLFEWIHSVDSLKLANLISEEAKNQKKVQKVLLQVNVSGESSKTGFSEKELFQTFPKILNLQSLSIKGLMTIAPLSENAEDSRPYFSKLRVFRDKLQTEFSVTLPELSMGMSQDYSVAIEEGATMVRIGRALFG